MSSNYLVHIGDISPDTSGIQNIVNATTEYNIYNAFKYTGAAGSYTIQKPIRSTNDVTDDTKLDELINLTSVPANQFLMKFAAGTNVAFTGTINNDQEFTYDGNKTIKLLEKAPMEEEGPVVGKDLVGKPLLDILQELTSGGGPVSGEGHPELKNDISELTLLDADSLPGSIASRASIVSSGRGGGKRKTKSKRSSKKKRNTKKKRKTQNKKKSRKRSKK